MLELCQFVAVLSTALFAGAALYINVAEHPARMQCGTEIASTVFGPSYHRAAKMQASLAIAATLSAIAAWRLQNSVLWIAGAILIFAVIPFTLIVISPTNKRLLSPHIDRNSVHTRELLLRWGRLHAVRTAASLVATVIFLTAALSD